MARIVLVLLFVTLLTVLAFGLYPALRSSSFSLADSLKSRSARQASTFAVRRAVIVCQVGLRVIVLLGGSLFLAEFRSLRRINPGFEMRGVQVIRLDTQAVPAARREAIYPQLLEFVRALPGVSEACLAGQEPLACVMKQMPVRAPSPPSDEKRTAFEEVSSDYFRLLRLPLVQGRSFESESHAGEMVVNEVMAAERWPGQNPLGQTLLLGAERAPYVVVGVAGASKTIDLTEQPRPFFYILPRSPFLGEMVILTRSSLPLADLLGFVREKIRRDMRGVVLLDSSSLVEIVAGRLSVERTLAAWTLSVAGLALLLVVSGLVGMLSLFVSQRSQEMAIRLALGASPFDLSRWVLTQSSMLCVIGLAVGFGIFLSLQEYLSTYLIMVASSRLVVYLGVTALILVSCILASLGPALRVLKIEPARALRSE